MDEEEIPLEVKFHEHSETIDRWSQPFSSLPLAVRACGLTVMTILLLVISATWLSHYQSDMCPNFLTHWDATRNTMRVFRDFKDHEEKNMAFANFEQVWHLSGIYTMHIYFLSAISSPQTHGRQLFIWKHIYFNCLNRFCTKLN